MRFPSSTIRYVSVAGPTRQTSPMTTVGLALAAVLPMESPGRMWPMLTSVPVDTAVEMAEMIAFRQSAEEPMLFSGKAEEFTCCLCRLKLTEMHPISNVLYRGDVPYIHLPAVAGFKGIILHISRDNHLHSPRTEFAGGNH